MNVSLHIFIHHKGFFVDDGMSKYEGIVPRNAMLINRVI